VKRKVAFRELEQVLRAAVARDAVAVPESETHRLESAARPDLPLLELLRELSAELELPSGRTAVARHCERRLKMAVGRDFPERRAVGATGATSVRSQLRCTAAASSPATRSRPTSSVGLVLTFAFDATFSPTAARDVERLCETSDASPSHWMHAAAAGALGSLP